MFLPFRRPSERQPRRFASQAYPSRHSKRRAALGAGRSWKTSRAARCSRRSPS